MNVTAATLTAPTRTRTWATFALVAALLASIFSSAIGIHAVSAQGTQADLASAVPADTVLFMSVNLDQSSDQWDLTYSLLERAGISDLAETTAGASAEDLGDVAEANNVTGSGAIVFTDADSLVSYSSTDLAGTAMETGMTMDATDMEEISEDIPEGFALIVQPDDAAALSAQFVQMTEDEAITNDTTVETVEYSGVTITYWESDDPAVVGTATAEVDGTVVLATRSSDIEPIIDAVQGNIDTLADSDGFNAVSERVQADSLIFGYMNLDVMITAFQNDPAFMEEFGEIATPEDMEAGKGHAGWVLYASEGGFHMDSVVVPNDPSSIPAAGSFTQGLAGKIPADVMLYSGAQDFSSTGISEFLGSTLQVALTEDASEGTPTAGPTPTMDEAWEIAEAQLGFHPENDLLSKLDGEYAVFLGIYDLELGFPSPEFLFISETSDAATLEQTTATITQLVEQMNEGDYEVSSRSVDGGELTVITLDSADTSGIPVVIEYGVVDGEMLIGVNGAIDRYLDPSTPKLADDTNFQDTFALLPSDNVVNVSYVNIEGQVMPLLDWLSTMLLGSTTMLDDDEACAEYATQEEAQAALDADEDGSLWMLDWDGDGEACEDFFGTTTPAASPASISSQINIPAAGSVTWVDDEAVYTSSILVIGG